MPITFAFDHRAFDYGDCLPLFDKFDEIFENPEVVLTGNNQKSSFTDTPSGVQPSVGVLFVYGVKSSIFLHIDKGFFRVL